MQSGSCHCGAVKFTAQGELDQAIECNCSHCSRKGFLLWFIPSESLTVTAGEDKLSTYTFNKHVIKHQFCSVCGCQPFGIGKKPDGTQMAAINVRCVEGIDLADIKRVPVNGKEF
ncbi:CENP-V/GFA domain-containing protein [Candidatus Nitrotoga sp. BS]|uniref:GFA family protein n=1 Tax=Candidatus Nitrotoga sp. BS TaxID=2890408 RepID=UPI001EF39A72|nr:GFA family protein [Candidatus Nitrotoga sp. BS]CAH1201364.1 CENP-V/GFA domain-containing protein [Candidatus Nitrotoga sp. BS]